jgi:hypothetical protein
MTGVSAQDGSTFQESPKSVARVSGRFCGVKKSSFWLSFELPQRPHVLPVERIRMLLGYQIEGDLCHSVSQGVSTGCRYALLPVNVSVYYLGRWVLNSRTL